MIDSKWFCRQGAKSAKKNLIKGPVSVIFRFSLDTSVSEHVGFTSFSWRTPQGVLKGNLGALAAKEFIRN
jgi:hypothetical protein